MVMKLWMAKNLLNRYYVSALSMSVNDAKEHPVITGLERVSRPGRRTYSRKQDIPHVLSGIGVAIISTPKGVMTGVRARQLGVGGEILCKVW